LDHVYTGADMLTKWFHHGRHQRAPVSSTQHNRFTLRSRVL